jgi:hypothetical protein
MPITSIGVIVFRKYENELQYLMIRRKDTLGFIDFMRGKYSVFNKDYIMNMLKQMTNQEKEQLKTETFDKLWLQIWGNEMLSNQYRIEETSSREKFHFLKSGVYVKSDFYTLADLIDESNKYECWEEAEWGFPKGRRNYQEKDYECALREFYEETGINVEHLNNIKNILPFEEIFTGSNYKSYRHKYFLTNISDKIYLNMNNYEKTEVSKMEWKNYEDCIATIRPYNLEKKRMITNINNTLKNYRIFSF